MKGEEKKQKLNLKSELKFLSITWSSLCSGKINLDLDIQNPWGKVMGRSGLRFELFVVKNGVKLAR